MIRFYYDFPLESDPRVTFWQRRQLYVAHGTMARATAAQALPLPTLALVDIIFPKLGLPRSGCICNSFPIRSNTRLRYFEATISPGNCIMKFLEV